MTATQFELRRGTAAEMASFTGAPGEITYETDTGRIVFHDGLTAGGAFKVPTISDVRKGTLVHAIAGGTADALTLDFGSGLRPSAYTDGMAVWFEVASNNTGAATLNITGADGSGLGAIALKKTGGASALAADDLVAGAKHLAIYDSTGPKFQVVTIGVTTPQVAIVNSTTATAIGGGAASWTKMAISTEVYDPSGLLTISGSVITLIAGTYEVDGFATGGSNAGNATAPQVRLQNTSDASTAASGPSLSSANSDVDVVLPILGQFTISGAKNFELQASTKVTPALLAPAGAGTFQALRFRKIA